MELWGFSHSKLSNSRFLLLQRVGAHGGNNNNGGNRTADELPPAPSPNPPDLSRTIEATPELTSALTNPNQPRRAVLEYHVRRNGADAVERVEVNFFHKEGTGAQIDCKEEADAFTRNLEGNEAYQRYTRAGYSNPMVRYFLPDGPDADRFLDVQETSLSNIRNIQENGRTADEVRRGVTAGSEEANDGFNSTGMSLAQARAKIREMRNKNDREINKILEALASGDWDAVKRGARLLAKAGKLSAMDVSAIYTDMKRRLEERNSRLREQLAHLGTNPAPERRASIERAMRENNLTLEGIPEHLRDAVEDARNSQENADGIVNKIERIDSASWR